MTQRYFSRQPVVGPSVELQGDEARHLSRVMRAQPGDETIVFDGSGAEFRCEITDVQRNSVQLSVLERREIDRESPIALTLAVSLPKGDRQRWLVEKLTELGVTCLQPLKTERSVAQPSDNALERLRRAVIEASKQCGRNRLMDVAEAMPWPEFVSQAEENNGTLRIVADPSGTAQACDLLPHDTAQQREIERPREIIGAIGPEGGFSPEELDIARSQGWQIMNLGERILRVETAAVAIASVVAMQPRHK